MLVFDNEQRGLGVRVTATGSKRYLAQYSFHGQKRRVPRGSCSGVSLAKARDAVRAMMDDVAKGIDPAKLRDELLDGEIFYTLEEARVIIEHWRRHYKEVRPHSSLGYKPPAPEVLISTRQAAQPKPAPPGASSLAPRPTMN